jgi:hypothetical protein
MRSLNMTTQGRFKTIITGAFCCALLGSCYVSGQNDASPVATPTASVSLSLPPCVSHDCDCKDFVSQDQAQRVLDLTPYKDPHGLDEDGDRVACEGLE